jgi:hypothetical protein
VSSASAPVSARPQGRVKFVASATLLLALAGVASAGSATALGLSTPVNAPSLPTAPITSLPSLPSLPALPKAPTVAIPAPVTNTTAGGGTVSSGGQSLGSAVGSVGSAVGANLPAPVGGAVSSAGTAVGGAVSGGTAAVGGAISGGTSSVGGTVGGVGGTVGGVVNGVVNGVTSGGPVGGTTGTLPIPGIPVLPSSPTNPLQPGTGAGSTPISGTGPFATTPGSKGAKGTAASSTLGPAGISLAQAWGSGPNSVLLTNDLLPSSAAETSVVAVPAPMLAAAAQASQAQDGDLLGFVSRHALPGLLVAIATALIGFVAAGDIKAFEPKFAALSLRLHALDARAKASVQRFAKTPSTQVKG